MHRTNFEELSLEVARPSPSAARQVMEWRNDPLTLSMFYNGEPKVWDKFYSEFCNDYFDDTWAPSYFLLNAGKRVAFIRFKRVINPWGQRIPSCDISVNVDPKQRGQGLGTAAVRLACEAVLQSGIEEIIAEVKVENLASQRTFCSAGFVQQDEIKKTLPSGVNLNVGRYRLAKYRSGLLRSDKVFVIAEAGSNWRVGNSIRDRKMGRALIEAAKEAGADAVKFQTYRANTTYVSNAGASDYLEKAGQKEDISSIFRDLEMPYELVAELAGYSKEVGIEFMSTPFSETDFDAIDPFVHIHKIASYEISHSHLIRKAAHSGKPLILSTGAAVPEDIAWAVNQFREQGGSDLCVMQCTAKYPAPLSSLNLRTIPWLRSQFNVVPGFSDHSRDPIAGPIAAVALGARVVEKHFTFDNRLPGPDHAFAVTVAELTQMVAEIRDVELALGDGIKRVLPEERELAGFARRGLQAVTSIKKGEMLREGVNIAILRPGKQKLGLHPKYLPNLEGKPASRNILEGDGLAFGDWLD